MVRAAVAAFGIPFLLSLGALAVVRYTRDAGPRSHRPATGAARDAGREPSTDPLAMLSQGKDLENFGRRRADQLRLDALRKLVPDRVAEDWCAALADVTHRALSEATQDVVRAAAPAFWPVFLSHEPATATPEQVLAEVSYAQVDVCLAAVSRIGDQTDRQEMAGYVKSQVVKIAELLEMRPVDVHRLYSRELPKVSDAVETTPQQRAERILDQAAAALPTANAKKTEALRNLLPKSRFDTLMGAFDDAKPGK